MTIKKFFTATLVYYFISVLPADSGLLAQQPQKIDPTVKIERDFDNKTPNIHKSTLNSSINDTLSNFNLNFNYSIFDKPYRDLYEFSPMPSVQIQNRVETSYPVLIARASLGFPASPMADIRFQPHLKGGHILQLNSSFSGFYDKIALVSINEELKTEKSKEKAAANNNVFNLGGTYGYNWHNGELSLGINYKTNYNTYYGFAPSSVYDQSAMPDDISSFYTSIRDNSYMKEHFSHRYNQFGARFTIRSIDAAEKGAKFNYRLNIAYRNTSDKLPENSVISLGAETPSLSENYIQINGEAGPTFGKYNRFAIGFNYQTVVYNNIQDYNYGIVEINPQYTFEMERLVFKSGVKMSFRYTNRPGADRYHNTIFTQASLSYEIAKRHLWIYANIDGGNYINSYSELLEENKWISQYADLRAASLPFLFKTGLNGQIHNRFSYNFYMKFAAHNGLLQYVPSGEILNDNSISTPDSRLYTAYSNHREFAVGGELLWESKHFTAGTTFEYSNYSNGKKSTLQNGDKPYGYSPLKWNIHGTYNYRERIFVGLSANIRGKAPLYTPLSGTGIADQQQAEIRGFCNLSTNIRYVIDQNFSVFITGENLLNTQIQYYPQYLEKGISFSAGVLVKL